MRRSPFGVHQLNVATKDSAFELVERGSDIRTGSVWSRTYTGVLVPGAVVTDDEPLG